MGLPRLIDKSCLPSFVTMYNAWTKKKETKLEDKNGLQTQCQKTYGKSGCDFSCKKSWKYISYAITIIILGLEF